MDIKSQFKAALEQNGAPAELTAEILAASDLELKSFADRIDESPFSIGDWMRAMIVFKKWELKEKRPLGLEHRFEYLSCVVESVSSHSNLISFPDLTQSFLNTHGVE